MLRILQTDFFGDHNLGLFAKVSDKFCLAGNVMTEKVAAKIEATLKVPTVTTNIFDTPLCGIFAAMNSNGLLLPKLACDDEVKKLKEIGKKLGFSVKVLNTKYTATGNLVLCNDMGAVVSKLLSRKDRSDIEDCLGVETVVSTIAGMDTVGSTGIATNKGCLLHRDADEKEMGIIGNALKVDVDIGTANFGSPFVGSCLIANSNGCVAGYSTTGHEMNRIMETLKFL